MLASEPNRQTVDLTGLRILVVDDSPELGQSTKLVLELLGAEVGLAASGAEADLLLCETVPDLALVDFYLRGEELAVGLINRLGDRGVTVIVLTGDSDLPVTLRNVVAVLRKPLDLSLFFSTLRSFAEGR